MKKLFLIVTILFMTTAISNVFGQSAKEVKLSANKQTVDAGSKLTFKLIEVKDTRCPADVNCVWAGNAVVKISIAKGKSAAKMFELNTTSEPTFISYQGYTVTLTELSPTPKSNDSSAKNYTVKLMLSKIPKGK
jgi:hypothetical protein